ncbi:MAG: hypothetical protein HYR85_25865 [Planctomycetes bacterium]|nr:hypothetical protein [Planctomycetota bacterium]
MKVARFPRAPRGIVGTVIDVRDPDTDDVFVITAYDLRGKALAAYRRRMKNRS